MQGKPVHKLGDIYGEADTYSLYNRTGATLTAGQVVCLDIERAQGETTNSNKGDAASCFANADRPDSAAKGKYPAFVHLGPDNSNAGTLQSGPLGTTNDNALGRFVGFGIVEARLKTSQTIIKGDMLAVDVASTYFQLKRASASAAGVDAVVGMALEAERTTVLPAVAGAAVLSTRVLFWGMNNPQGYNPAVS